MDRERARREGRERARLLRTRELDGELRPGMRRLWRLRAGSFRAGWPLARGRDGGIRDRQGARRRGRTGCLRNTGRSDVGGGVHAPRLTALGAGRRLPARRRRRREWIGERVLSDPADRFVAFVHHAGVRDRRWRGLRLLRQQRLARGRSLAESGRLRISSRAASGAHASRAGSDGKMREDQAVARALEVSDVAEPRGADSPENAVLGRSERVVGGSEVGAGDQARTGDIQLGKLTLYQLSYTRS